MSCLVRHRKAGWPPAGYLKNSTHGDPKTDHKALQLSINTIASGTPLAHPLNKLWTEIVAGPLSQDAIQRHALNASDQNCYFIPHLEANIIRSLFGIPTIPYKHY